MVQQGLCQQEIIQALWKMGNCLDTFQQTAPITSAASVVLQSSIATTQPAPSTSASPAPIWFNWNHKACCDFSNGVQYTINVLNSYLLRPIQGGLYDFVALRRRFDLGITFMEVK